MSALRVLGLALLTMVLNTAAAQELVLAINDGASYHDGSPVTERYRPLQELLSRELKRPVKLQSVEKYADFDRGLSDDRYDLAFIHPAHIGLRAVKNGKYVGVVTAKDYTNYRAQVMVRKDSPLRSIQDLKGKKIGVPNMDTITSVMFNANLKELGFVRPEQSFTFTRYQDALPFMIDNGFVDAAVTGSDSVARDWVAKGGRIIAETKPVPVKQFLVSKRMKDAERSKIQDILLALTDTDAGKAVLKKISMPGFVPWNDVVMRDATSRLGL
jgi:phosphonate transport system substrate-binding protein